ncbi:hypothetical protein E2562_038113 [Oryza meyeriana var. granulata]|uniref:Uncharacterized protein n=1 Tax=Oryza meyeriana var. granulata TaxID=110450 RepID=A0A6G1C219_9ORYZ|nr:hypothetical protein E2562_038113 [Oryza meyeriana var. granulata]
MDRRVLASLLLLLAVVLSHSGPAAGDMRVVLAGGKGALHGIDTAVRQLMMAPADMASARLEDAVDPELGMDMELHRRILAANIGPGALKPDRPACPQTCPARGGSYTGRGCKTVYRCNNNGG